MCSSTSILLRPLSSVLALSCLLASCGERPAAERTTVSKSEVAVGGLVSIRRETRTTEPVEIADEAAQTPQSGSLTAGDYDDLLNPEQYAKYAGNVLQHVRGELPFVDTRTRVAVKIVDPAGKPVPHARVTVARKGNPLRLVSGADGVASFYPGFDGVDGRTKVSVTSDAGVASRTLSLQGRGLQNAVLTVPGQGRAVSAMDLVIVLDTTGSMGDEMAYLQAELESILARLKRDAGNLDLRIGLVLYRDDGDDYVTRSFDPTSDVRAIRETLGEQSADGGGDMPEAVDQALAQAAHMPWRPDAAKALLLIADAPPHEKAMDATLDLTQSLRARGVQIVPVAASGVEDSAQYVMRTMAVLTQGRYIFLTDDSGIGNAHAEPDISCYVVTRLDQLIARVLAGLVTGQRIEPGRAEIIRTVGDYDGGRCRTGAQN